MVSVQRLARSIYLQQTERHPIAFMKKNNEMIILGSETPGLWKKEDYRNNRKKQGKLFIKEQGWQHS